MAATNRPAATRDRHGTALENPPIARVPPLEVLDRVQARLLGTLEEATTFLVATIRSGRRLRLVALVDTNLVVTSLRQERNGPVAGVVLQQRGRPH